MSTPAVLRMCVVVMAVSTSPVPKTHRRLLGALDEREDAKAVRDRALLRLAFDLGLRRGELASLDLEHLNLDACTLAVLGKGQEGRELLSLPSETTAVLRAWLEQRGLEPGPLFIDFDRARKG